VSKLFLFALLTFQASAFALPATDAVNNTVSKMLNILRSANDRTQVSGLCALVRSDIDTNVIGNELLGANYGTLDRDADGIRKFKALVPSIIMDQFYGLLSDKGGAAFKVGGLVPKGGSRTGVKVVIDGTNFVVTVLKSNNKIVDVEWNNFSLVNVKRDEFQRDLERFWNVNNFASLPVSELVKRLESEGVNKCGT
jgi:ABC-type transporter MlaC component